MIILVIDYFGGNREEKCFTDVQEVASFSDFLELSHSGIIVDSRLTI